MQGVQKLRRTAYCTICCNDEVERQRGRWTFCETITISPNVIPNSYFVKAKNQQPWASWAQRRKGYNGMVKESDPGR